MTKLVDINPPEWASETNYTTGPYPGQPTKVEPGPSVYGQGIVPTAKVNAENENWLRNQQTEQQRILSFDRLTDVRSFITLSADNTTLRSSLAWNSLRKCWIGLLSVSTIHYWMGFDRNLKPYKSYQLLAGTASNFTTVSDTAYHKISDTTILVGASGAWEAFNATTAATPTTGTLSGGQLWMLPEGQGFTSATGTAMFPSKNAAGTALSVERWTGAGFTRVTLPATVPPTDAKFYQDPSGRIWLLSGYRAFYSVNDGVSWTAVATAATVPLNDSLYDPVAGLWLTTAISGGGTLVYQSAYATPGVSPLLVYSYSNYALRGTQQMGRYGIAFGTVKTPNNASTTATSEAVMITNTYGRTWNMATPISVRPGSSGFPTLDLAEAAPVSGRISVSDEGFAAFVRRTSGSLFSQVYGCRGITQVDSSMI